MQKIFWIVAFSMIGALLGSAAKAFTAPSVTGGNGANGTIQQDVAVCDPFNPMNCLRPDVSGSLPVTGNVTVTPTPNVGTWTSKNGVISAGGTSQIVAGANASRKRIFVQNPCFAAGQGISASEAIYLSFTGPAGVNNGTSIEVLPCGGYDSDAGPVSTQTLTINAATTGHKFVAGEMQ